MALLDVLTGPLGISFVAASMIAVAWYGHELLAIARKLSVYARAGLVLLVVLAVALAAGAVRIDMAALDMLLEPFGALFWAVLELLGFGGEAA